MGVDAHPIQVEVNTGEAGELKFILVGRPDAAVKESQRLCLEVAEREGFEPPEPFGSIVFKTTAFGHSAISPKFVACV